MTPLDRFAPDLERFRSRSLLYNELVGLFALVLLVCAVLLLVAAEWPRLTNRVGAEARTSRARRRRKSSLTLVHGDGEEDDFAASVERDLANLPVIGERDDRSRR